MAIRGSLLLTKYLGKLSRYYIILSEHFPSSYGFHLNFELDIIPE
jgi:hypothetical protein